MNKKITEISFPVTQSDESTGICAAAIIGQAANQAADSNIFSEYVRRKSEHTRARHGFELRKFSAFLRGIGIDNQGMTEPEEWRVITHGLIEAYREYLLRESYSINNINQIIFIIRKYAKLAGKAGFIDYSELYKIQEIESYRTKEAKHLDTQREAANIATRYQKPGAKKETNVQITYEQAQLLKHGQPKTLAGLRDKLLITILLDHGVRISEAMALKGESFDMENRTITFYRSKTDQTDKHMMTADSFQATQEYFKVIPQEESKSIWISVNKIDRPNRSGFSIRAAAKRVTEMGNRIGLEKLSPHDCRHYFATAAKRGGTDTLDIMRAGGWVTVTMVNRYIDKDKISNLNVKLG